MEALLALALGWVILGLYLFARTRIRQTDGKAAHMNEDPVSSSGEEPSEISRDLDEGEGGSVRASKGPDLDYKLANTLLSVYIAKWFIAAIILAVVFTVCGRY